MFQTAGTVIWILFHIFGQGRVKVMVERLMLIQWSWHLLEQRPKTRFVFRTINDIVWAWNIGVYWLEKAYWTCIWLPITGAFFRACLSSEIPSKLHLQHRDTYSTTILPEEELNSGLWMKTIHRYYESKRLTIGLRENNEDDSRSLTVTSAAACDEYVGMYSAQQWIDGNTYTSIGDAGAI